MIVLAVVSMVTIAFLIPLLVLVRVVAEDRALSGAEQDARAVAGLLTVVGETERIGDAIDQIDAESRHRITVILAGGERLGAALSVGERDLRLARSGQAFTTSTGGGRLILVPVRAGDGSVGVVGVAVSAGELSRGVGSSRVVLALVALLLAGLGVALADRLARSTVASVEELGEVAARLVSGDLDARVGEGGPPEVSGVGHTINTLAARIVDLLRVEREAIADLSHRLRTPLTALQLDVDSLRSKAERDRLGADVARVSQAVTTLIRGARTYGDRSSSQTADLAAVASERVAFWSAPAEDQDRSWTWSPPDEPIVVGAGAEELSAALDALLGNVFQHTPEGTPFGVEVTVDRTRRVATLVVEDQGPGIRIEPRRGRSGGASTGLGLDIVRQTAERFGGTLTIGEQPRRGARFEIVLPLVEARPKP